MAGYIPRRFTCPRAVTHPSSNRAQCRLTVLSVDRTQRASHYTAHIVSVVVGLGLGLQCDGIGRHFRTQGPNYVNILR